MREHTMYPDTRRGSTGSHLGETDKDRKMRQVSDSNRRVERQLVKHLKEIDQHLQVNLKQMSGNYEMKSASVSPPLSSPSPKYLASSLESMDDSNGSSPRGSRRLQRPSDLGHKNQLRKHKQQGTTQRLSESQAQRDADNHLMQPREKTFTIIDHGLLTDTEGATDNYNEAKSRIKTLDVHDRERLLQGTNVKNKQANIRNEKVNSYVSISKKKLNRSELTTFNRVLNSSSKAIDSIVNNTSLSHSKLSNTMDKDNKIHGVMSPKEIYGKEQEVFAFNCNEIPTGSDKRRHLEVSKIPTAQNGGQILARDELNRRQLRKMHILSNLNKKHVRDPSEDDIFRRREKDLRGGRKFSHVPLPPQGLYQTNGSVDAEKPRPKSAMFSSQRRPHFTTLEDDDSVFLDDLDIIDIDDDGNSSSDDDMLSSSFVAPLTSHSRHTLGLHTRSTSDISPSLLRRSRDLQLQAKENNGLRQISNKPDSSKPDVSQRSAFDVPSKISSSEKLFSDGIGECENGVILPKHAPSSTTDPKGQLSPKSEPINFLKPRDRIEIVDTNASNVKPDRGQGRAIPQFPRKLKPLFKPQNLNNSGNSDGELELVEKGDVLAGISPAVNLKSRENALLTNTVLRASSNLHQNKKIQRSRQKTWTPGVGAINNRDILKRPLGSMANNARQRHKPDVKVGTRRRARTSSELKKCSPKELESLKSGEVDSVEGNNVLDNDLTGANLDLSDGLRNCRYLRNNTDLDALSTVDVASF